MDIREQLQDLGEIFLGRRPFTNASHVALTVRLRPGDPKVKTERKVLGRYRANTLLFRTHLTVDPVRVEAAWALLGTQTLDGAIVLEAELVSRVPLVGAVYRWTGVQTFGNGVRIFCHHVAILPGANVPDIRICARSEKLAVRYARDYLDRIPETDWSREDIWRSQHSMAISDVTDIALNRYGSVCLSGRYPEYNWWSVGEKALVRAGSVWLQQAEDGRWIQGDRPHDLERYHRWRDEQRAASAPPPIPAEDLEAFVL